MAPATTQFDRGPNSRSNFVTEIEGTLWSARGIRHIKKIFWQLLGYQRRDDLCPLGATDPAIRDGSIEARVFARHDQLILVHLEVKGGGWNPLAIERLTLTFRREYRYVASLVEDANQTGWSLVYLPEIPVRPGGMAERLLRQVGSLDQSIYQQSRSLGQLQTVDRGGQPRRLADLIAAYDRVFAVAKCQVGPPARVRPTIAPRPSSMSVVSPEAPARRDELPYLRAMIRGQSPPRPIPAVRRDVALPPPVTSTPAPAKPIPGRRPPAAPAEDDYPRFSARQERAVLEELAAVSTWRRIRRGDRIRRKRVPLAGSESRYRQLRDLLVMHNLHYCDHLARKFARSRDEYDEFFQESVLGVMHVIDLIDPSMHYRLSMMAQVRIRHSILRWIKFRRPLIRREPTSSALRLDGLRRRDRRMVISAIDEVQDRLIDDPWAALVAELDAVTRTKYIAAAVERLPERLATIIEGRFGLDGSGPRTLKQVARTLGLTRERVRQLEAKALQKLRYDLIHRLDYSASGVNHLLRAALKHRRIIVAAAKPGPPDVPPAPGPSADRAGDFDVP